VKIGPLAAYYQVPLRHILLVHIISVFLMIYNFQSLSLIQKLTAVSYFFQIYDDTSLPNGVLRLQKKGGHGRHNG
jgi:peptidyl-tRNA hydrolase, PTH1 family